MPVSRVALCHPVSSPCYDSPTRCLPSQVLLERCSRCCSSLGAAREQVSVDPACPGYLPHSPDA